jgi:hypothetical protein
VNSTGAIVGEPDRPGQPRAPWWAPFRRPLTWVAILGFAALNAVVLSLGIPKIWSVLVTGVLLAATVAVVTRPATVWVPLVVFLAVLATHAVLRLGGLPAFLVFEGALLLVVIVLWWRRRTPSPG